MARRHAPAPSAAASPPTAVADESLDLWNGWFESQRDLFGASLDQLAMTQQSMLKSWLAMVDAMAEALQAPLEGGLQLAWGGLDRSGRPFASSWTFAPPDLYRLAPPLMQAWWAPWSPLMERGGEQLG